eukprot:6667833-Prymnesium_polylepis.1
MVVRLRWGAGRMLHPPGRLLHIEQLHFLCLGASRATDTGMHNRLGTTRLGRRSGGQSVVETAVASRRSQCVPQASSHGRWRRGRRERDAAR